MFVYILGAGAMGCVFGAKLSAAGWRVHLIDVNAKQIAAINEAGLKLSGDNGEKTYRLPASNAADAKETADLIIVFTKSLHTSDAIASMKHAIDDKTYVLTLQNGLGNAEKIAACVARDRILEGVTTVPADLVSPGVVASHGSGGVQFFTLTGETAPIVEEISAALARAGIDAKADPAIREAIWTKVIFNATMNATCALLDTTPGPLGDREDGVALAAALIEEGASVASASGCPIDAAGVHAMAKMSMTQHRNHIPSMLQDLRAGRRTEVDDINGAIVRQARAHSVGAPMHETLWRLMRVREDL
ncbi:ketopantoate reductase family protein [Hyphococcus sp.]|uniref:ketopantoate reductase family protein n=1 Tax=Hyphococcus sp. TaxID=2038636 RepID=UPI0035C70E53